MSNRLFIEFAGTDEFEQFQLGETDTPEEVARYWIKRRFEKSHMWAISAFVVRDEDVIDVDSILIKINEDADNLRRINREQEELENYQRLKLKFEGK